MASSSVRLSRPGISIDHLATAEFVVIAHPSLDFGNKTKLALEDLHGLDFINLSARSPLGQILATRMQSNEIQLRTVANVETYQMAKALVAHGAGVALIDEITARSSGHDNVVALYLDPPLPFEISILHTVSDPFTVLTQRFINHLKTEMAAFLQQPLGMNS